MPGIYVSRRNILHRGRAAAPPVVPTWNQTDSATQNASLSTVTFTAVNIGAASADRIVVVLYNCQAANATGLTIGGVAATLAVAEGSVISGLQIWYAAVPTGTTADIVVTAGSNMIAESIIVGKLTSVTTTPSNINTAINSSDPSPISVIVPASGFGIVGIYGSSSLTSWSNATEDARITDSNSLPLVMAHDSTAGTNTVGANGVVGTTHLVSASWGP